MESILSNFDIEDRKNFWKLYPSFKTPKEYQDLYKNDKSKGKVRSSDIMWACHFVYDKTKHNPWRNYDEDDRIDVINTDILNNQKFKWKPYLVVLEAVKIDLLDEMERMYYALVDKMDQRTKMLKDAVYTIESAKSIDDIYLRTDKLRIELNRMKEAMDGRDEDGQTKGGRRESPGERGDI
jgi:hypothetical protein